MGKNDPPECDTPSLDDDSSIRIAGLTHELNYRIHQLLWCEVSVLLDNGVLVGGTIVFVGFDFIEMLLPTKHYGEHIKETEENEHPIGRTLIFPIAKIVCIESDSSCNYE